MAKKNPLVIVLSILALLFMYFTFTIHWMFIIAAVILTMINWRLLTKNN